MIPKSDRNSQGSSKESRSLFVSAGRRMVGCHPMANGHGSNEPETTRTEPKGTDANRRTCKPTRGNDGGRLAGAAENRRNSNETHPEKRNSRMTDAPGGEPGSVILANSRRRSDFAITPNMSRALSRDKFGQTPCFSGPGLIIWPASLPRWTCLDRRASSQSNIRGFAGRAAAASDRRGSPPRALYVAGVASQFVATAGGVTFGLKSLPAGVPREQRPRE